jgi:hypothetical protein
MLSKESLEILDQHNDPTNQMFKLFDLDNKRINLASFENFPFGKELKKKFDNIITIDEVKNYFKDESSMINFKYNFFNEFYSFLFGVIVKFDALNIGSKKDEKETGKYLNHIYNIPSDFETQLKVSISYSKYVTKRFFEIYPHLKTQFKPGTDNNIDNKLVEWYSREKFQRQMILIDLRELAEKYTIQVKKGIRNPITPERLELYKKIIDKIAEAKARGFKATITSICEAVDPNNDNIYKLRVAFYEWKRNKKNKLLFDSIMKEAEVKWKYEMLKNLNI